ncbi:hypothetical protein F4778DRAFT_736963 [Xylariomycetidae sp. FL2044]|nr:hypothetical protein F4778DRAFT_736963 [Xylariomycetidae sp. FL2044]
MVLLPYQCLTTLGQGSIICAAKATSLYTYDIKTNSPHLTSWSHPFTRQSENGKPGDIQGDEGSAEQGEQPPSKRRKLETAETPDSEPADTQTAAADAEPEPLSKRQRKQKQKEQRSKHAPQSEVPFIILLTATEDGSHVVAVSGQDKTLWVFEHDGKGTLKELSQRMMPKRPSAIKISADGKTIFSADKFGDVYALPLVVSASGTPSRSSTPQQQRTAPKGANALTVHSQRNLRALEEQRKGLAKEQDLPKDGPSFEHALLLGHVSMLTAVALATVEGRPYIITADRDEHIRVSRGVPQAHVIETFCLGHESFISALCVPPSRPEVLISGGGDPALFLWDWRAGRLVGKADLLGLVQKATGAAAAAAAVIDQVAVSQLYSYDTEQGCYILVLCERIPAIFIFQLTPQSILEHIQTLNTPGNPLAATIVGGGGGGAPEKRLIVAVDHASPGSQHNTSAATTAHSLLRFGLDDGPTWTPQGHVEDTTPNANADAIKLELSREGLDKALYFVENLRKTEFEDDTEAGKSSSSAVRGGGGGGDAATRD